MFAPLGCKEISGCRLQVSGCKEIWMFLSVVQVSFYLVCFKTLDPESEFNEFEPRLKSAKSRFQLSAGLNLETLNTILRASSQI